MAEEIRKKTRLMIAVKQSMDAFEWTLDKIIGTNTAGFEILILHVKEGSDGPVLGASASDGKHSDGESAGVDGQDTAEKPKIELVDSDGESAGVDGQNTAKKPKIELADSDGQSAGVDGQDTAKEPKIELVDSDGESAGVDGQDTAEKPKIELVDSDGESAGVDGQGSAKEPKIESAGVDGQDTAKEPKIELVEYDPEAAWVEGESHLLEYFKQRCKQIGIAYKAWTENGSPKVVIPNEVKRVNPDLLVLGSRNIPPDIEDIDPPVSDYAEHVECPVLKVKRSAEKKLGI